jgi:DNA invertase Pin-like site-specific DNA recombinase
MSSIAYSYVRFSTPEQSRGDSLRRQTEAAQAWCDRHDARLDSSTTLHDLGKSAFKGVHRTNPDRNALAGFLKLVEDGKVARGSFLILESLDRLTREDIQPALRLLLNLTGNGIRVVQLKPVEQIFDDKSDMMPLMMALMELSRGNSESRVKSERIGAAWRNKRANARESKLIAGRTHTRTGRPLTTSLPAWVKITSISNDRYTLALIPERAKIVSKIFSLASQGLGLLRVVQKLVEDGTPTFGRLLSKEQIAAYEDSRRKEGRPVTEAERRSLHRPGHWYKGKWVVSEWNRSYVHSLLADRRALGEHLPLSRTGAGAKQGRHPHGLPIKDYFPPVIDEAVFNKVRAVMSARKPIEGRRVGSRVELFARLVCDALDGSSYYTATRTETKPDGTKQHWRSLISAAAEQGRGPKRSFPLPTFERAILSMLKEIKPSEVLGQRPKDSSVEALERQLNWLSERQAELAAELRNGDVPVIAQQLRELAAEEEETADQLDQAKQLEAKPLTETWRDLGEVLAAAEKHDPDARRRLRSAIARVVESIQMIVVARGRDRLAAVQVNFAGAKARRNYIIIHRPAAWAGNGHGGKLRPGRWWCAGVKHGFGGDGLPFNKEDLRDPEQAQWALGSLDAYPKNVIDRLLAGGEPLP